MERIEIINNLKRDGAWYRFNGIIFASVENLADEEIFNQISYKAYKKRSGRKTFNTPFSESQPKGSIASCPGETRKLIPRA